MIESPTEAGPLTAPLVLPPDVVIVPVASLPDHVRRRLADDDGYAVTRPRSRAPSAVVDADSARLLDQFREPRTVVDAVVNYSRAAGRDAHEVLDAAYPLLRRFLHDRLLAAAGSPAAAEIAQSLAPGDRFAGITVVRPVQVLDDSELYEARWSDGSACALKVARRAQDPATRACLGNEVAVLARLAGTAAPRLLQYGYHEDRPYVVMEWLAGVDATTAAAEERRCAHLDDGRSLVEFCLRITAAYAALHARGVVHADVHPRNVLVLADGSIRIIDYGLSWPRDRRSTMQSRGGVGFFFEPELAAARLAGSPDPPATPVGEQYAVAALVYSLLAGCHYIDFSLDKQQLLEQIAMEPMLAMPERSGPCWSSVQVALRRALAKRPEDRHRSMADFARALHTAVRAAGAPTERVPPHHDLVDDVIARIALDEPLFRLRGLTPPTSSATYGAAGISYAAYRLALARTDPGLLAVADAWAVRAVHDETAADAFTNAELDIGPARIGPVSPYHTASGGWAVQAFVSHAMGDEPTLEQAIARFLAAVAAPCRDLELALGRGGVLLMCSALLEIAPWHETLRAVGAATLEEIWAAVDAEAPIRAGGGPPYLGIAHGWAGILYAVLDWCRTAGRPLPTTMPERLDQLAELAVNHGRGLRWPVSHQPPGRPAPEYLAGWCHGSAGYVHLWTAATRHLGASPWTDLAERAAWNAWEEPSGIAGLCCGLAGRAYAMLNLWKLTGDRRWVRRADQLAVAAATAPRGPATPKDSLYKGDTGIAVLLAELANPDHGAMPLFERPIW
jgi:serine/threonine-protein kinase